MPIQNKYQSTYLALTLAIIFVVCGVFDAGHILTSGISKEFQKQNTTHSAFEKNHVPDEDTYHHSKTESAFKKTSFKSIVNIDNEKAFISDCFIVAVEFSHTEYQSKIPFAQKRLYLRLNRLLI